MNLMLNQAGNPEPPTDMVRRLKQIDPRMGIRFVAYGGALGDTINYWAITMDWRDTDPRRKMILEGMIPASAAIDIVCQLPLDCSVDSAYGFVVSGFKAMNDDDAKHLLTRVTEFNRNHTEKQKEALIEEAVEVIKVNAPTLFADQGKTTTRVYQKGKKK